MKNHLNCDIIRDLIPLDSEGLCSEEAAKAAGTPVRLSFRVGEGPKASPQENLQSLLKFGSQFDNIEIK